MIRGVTTEREFYDREMTAIPPGESPWLPLYREAATWIPANHPVVDLGCGTGAFLELLAYWGHTGHLTGLDFSPAALSCATVSDDVTLQIVDLREWQPDPERAGNCTFTCLEVLEHLVDDRELVRRVPAGHQFIFSVPNYESEAHLRQFTTVGSIWERYDDLLTFRRWSAVALDDRKTIHCVDTVRRTDSW